MINADTVYPVIAIIFYLLLLLRVTSKQIRQNLLRWWIQIVQIIIPKIWVVVKSKWFIIFIFLAGVAIVVYLNPFRGNTTYSIQDNKESLTFSYLIERDESFLTLSDLGNTALAEKFKGKLVKKLRSNIADQVKNDSYNCVEVIAYRTDREMDFLIEYDYGFFNFAELIAYELSNVSGIDTLIDKWIPVEVPPPIIPPNSTMPLSDQEGIKIEFRLFNPNIPLIPKAPSKVCTYQGQVTNGQDYFVEIKSKDLCQRKLSSHNTFNPENNPIDKNEFVVSKLEICLDANGIIKQTDISIFQKPNDLLSDKEILKMVEGITKDLKFSTTGERWQCGKIFIAFKHSH